MKKAIFALLPLLMFSAGCSTYSYRKGMDKIHPAYAAGDFNDALDVTTKQIEGEASSPLVWQLNHAAILQAAGDHETAGEAWDNTLPLFDDLWQNERGLLAKSALAMLPANLGNDTYYARPHEGVMLYTYAMLNAWQRGDMDEARRLIACLITFRDQVFMEIEARVEKRKGADNASLAQSTTEDGLNNSTQDTSAVRDSSNEVAGFLMEDIEKRRQDELREDLEGYANYANPLAGFLTYLFLKTQGTGLYLTDINTAKRELDELGVFAPRNSVVAGAAANNWEVIADDSLNNSVFVFFETGLAPAQKEVRYDIPLPGGFVTKWFPSHAGVAYPKLERNSNYVPKLFVSASGQQQVEAEPLANFDAVVQQSFDDEWPAVLARQIAQSVVAVTVNAALNYAGNSAAKNVKNVYAKAGATIGTGLVAGLLSYAMINADERSWELLPKQVHVARLDIPENREITLSFPDGTWRQDITLGAGDVMAVWVKSTSPWQGAPLATQFKLK